MGVRPDTNGSTQPIWPRLLEEARRVRQGEPALAGLVDRVVLNRSSLAEALSAMLAFKLADASVSESELTALFVEAHRADPGLAAAAEADVRAVLERDPAARGVLQPFLFYKGFLALQAHRLAHRFLGEGRETLAFWIQSRVSELFQVDAHPAARIGVGVFIDHATGVVIGETAAVGDEVSMLHGVTLGATGADWGDRHPKIGRGVLLGAGAKVLGPITVGDHAKVASGSVVVKPVPAHCTVAGVPARLVSSPIGGSRPMEHTPADAAFDYVI